MNIIYHGKSLDIFFKGKVYNRRQKLSTANLTAAEYEALEYPDSLTLYTVTYPDNSIKKFIGDMEVDIIQEEFCTPQEYKALNPPDPYTLYTVTGNGITKKYLGKREIGTQNFEEIYLTQNEYDNLGESINPHALYHITDITGKSYFGKNLLIKEVELTSSEYEQLVEDDEVDQYTLYTLSDNGKQYLGDLELGASAVLTNKNISENGTYLASEDNADGYSSVTVAVPTSEPPIFHEIGVRENGVYNATDDNCDGFSKVTVAVPPPVLISKNVTANGTYTAASDSADGYNSVTVEVSAASPYVDDALAEEYSAIGMRKMIAMSEWINFPTQGTYEVCFKYTSVDSPNGRIFHLDNNNSNKLVLDVQTNGVPEIGVDDTWTGEGGRSAVQTLLSPNTFYTVALTVDSTNNVVKMFVNGVEAETIDVPCSSLSSQSWNITYLLRANIGNRQTYGNLYSYRRHTRLLTAAEILQNYQVDLQKYGQGV